MQQSNFLNTKNSTLKEICARVIAMLHAVILFEFLNKNSADKKVNYELPNTNRKFCVGNVVIDVKDI